MFDLDGTLVDSVPDLSRAVDAVLREQGYPPAGEFKARLWVGNGAAMLVLRALSDALRVPPEQVNDELQQRCLQSFYRHYDHFNGQYSVLFEGAGEALQRLQQAGVAMALITNKPAAFVPQLLGSLGIADFFQLTLGGDELPQKKPDPAPLLHVLSRLNVSAAKALMVGDSRNDIVAAKSARVASLAVTYGYNYGSPIEQEQPDWLTDNLVQFFKQDLGF